MYFLLLLITLACLIGARDRAGAARDKASKSDRDSWPVCQNCGREMPPYNAGVVLTWICPHCGESRRSIPSKGKKQTPVDPDF
jgi:predicted RNA-binding Zn-ribbon protein involved in translation (DUF1610 family)